MMQDALWEALCERWEPSGDGGERTSRAEVIADVFAAAGLSPGPNGGATLGQHIKRLTTESAATASSSSSSSGGKKTWPVRRRAAEQTLQQQNWPPSLHDYAQRAFAACAGRGAAAEAATERALRAAITAAIGRGALHATDWAREPLPHLSPGKRPFEFVVATPPPPPPPPLSSPSVAVASAQPQSLGRWLRRRDVEALAEDTDDVRMQKRAERFQESLRQLPKQRQQQKLCFSNPFRGARAMQPVRGTSQALEKPYLRLTTAPNPADVRPEPVLRRALALLLRKLGDGGEYAAACEQWKSIRQDLTVQRIRGQFAVDVYESHAREALVHADFGEFNQCLTQLLLLYREDDAGATTGNAHEFAAYRLLYLTLIAQHDGLALAISSLDQSALSSPVVVWAMALSRAARTRDYHNFFVVARRLASVGLPSKESARALVNELALKVRDAGIRAIIAAYRPSVEISFVQHELGFAKVAECSAFLRSYATVLTRDGREIDTKSSLFSVARSPPPQTATPVIF